MPRVAAAMEKWWHRLVPAVLFLPLTLCAFLAYEILAMPILCTTVCVANRKRRQRDERTGRRPEPDGCGGSADVGPEHDVGIVRSARCVVVAAFKKSLNITAVGLDWTWMPFWRLFTEDGRNRCAYVNMSHAAAGSGGVVLPAMRCAEHDLPPKPPGCVRIVFISDTHGKHELVDVPPGDVLCHCGDILVGWRNRLCGNGAARKALRSFDEWLGKQPHAHKVVIGGNHDGPLEQYALDLRQQQQQHPAMTTEAEIAQPFASATYLHDSGANLPLAGGRELSIWGCPWSAAGTSANQAFRGSPEAIASMPPGIDVLLSHSRLAPAALDRVAPRISASGHFHREHGVRFQHMPISRLAGGACYVAGGRLDVNAAICDSGYRVVNPAIVVDIDVTRKALLQRCDDAKNYSAYFGKMLSHLDRGLQLGWTQDWSGRNAYTSKQDSF